MVSFLSPLIFSMNAQTAANGGFAICSSAAKQKLESCVRATGNVALTTALTIASQAIGIFIVNIPVKQTVSCALSRHGSAQRSQTLRIVTQLLLGNSVREMASVAQTMTSTIAELMTFTVNYQAIALAPSGRTETGFSRSLQISLRLLSKFMQDLGTTFLELDH